MGERWGWHLWFPCRLVGVGRHGDFHLAGMAGSKQMLHLDPAAVMVVSFCYCCCLFRATPMAHGSSQVRG